MYPEFRNAFTVFVSVESERIHSIGLGVHLSCIPISRRLCERMYLDIALNLGHLFQERFPQRKNQCV